jgi:hypothetical protein
MILGIADSLLLRHISSLFFSCRTFQVSHLKAYGELLEKHFHRTVLDHMPKEAWKKLDDPEMVEAPDLNRFLFCKTLEDVEIGDQYHSKGSCLIARYGAIQRLVLEARIELLM